jgi:hypothetical protein
MIFGLSWSSWSKRGTFQTRKGQRLRNRAAKRKEWRLEKNGQLAINVCRIHTLDGMKDYVTCIPLEQAFKHGLRSQAVLGVLLGQIEPGDHFHRPLFPVNPASGD